MEKIAARFFQDNKDIEHVLAVVGGSDGYLYLELTKEKLVNVDLPAVEFKKWKPVVDKVFASFAKSDDITLVSAKVKEFSGKEIRNPAFANFDFDLSLIPATFDLEEDGGSMGKITYRKFNYDFTNPDIKMIADENDARLGYYVPPTYFKFLQRNLLNSEIKGMALIGKPGTGKSTDAIATVRSLGGIILIAQLSGGMLENNVFVNTKPNRQLSFFIDKIMKGGTLSPVEQKTYDELCKSSSSFIEVDEVIIRAIKLNCPVLLDEFAYANVLLKARFNVLTDGTRVFRHEGNDYPLPPNFYIYFTWNPGDDGTSDIPNALKSRFPVHIVPSISMNVHNERIKSYCEKKLGISSVDSKFIDMLYNFGNLVEKDQQRMKHHGGFFTIRSTQSFLSVVLCESVDAKNFQFELESKFVNSLWGTNFENTDAIRETLENSVFKPKIDELFLRYRATISVEKVKLAKPLASLVGDYGKATSASPSGSSSIDDDALASAIDDVFGEEKAAPASGKKEELPF